MPKETKKTTTTQEQITVPQTKEVKEVKKAKKPKAPKEDPVVETETVTMAAVEPVVVIPIVESTETAQLEESEYARLRGVVAKLTTEMFALSSTLKTVMKSLNKEHDKEIKLLSKKKRRKNGADKKPSGFLKPTKISSDLASFLKVEPSVEMSRTDVTKRVNAYINEHGLKNKINGRNLEADPVLTKLLNLGPDDNLSYFNLQRYLKPHFIKSVVLTATA